ncbi:MAG: hypothetical protein JXA42_08505 [Anaerolineales bacterium]|nr:hypothetical protein [Anaerolineales bacterium]
MASENSPRLVPDNCPQCGGDLPPGDGQTVTCRYCGSRLIRLQPGKSAAATKSPGVARGVHLKPIVCVDEQGVGMEAFKLLIPSNWEFRGGVQWVMDNPGIPVTISFQAYNPAGKEMFTVYPSMPFYWTNQPMVHMTFPVGSRYYGNEVRPPAPANVVLEQISLPRLAGNRPGFRIIKVEPMPEFAQKVQAARPNPSQATHSDAARAQLSYQEQETAIEEEFYTIVEHNMVQVPAFMGVVEHNWWQVQNLAWRAAAGELERTADLFQTILRSVKINPQWFARCSQIAEYLIRNQIQHIHNIGQVSRYISQVSNQISDENMAAYNQRQAVYDRLADDYSRVTRGVEAYYDPNLGHDVELPNTYDYAWANPLGEYLVTDDPNFNPNVGSTTQWDQLQRGG